MRKINNIWYMISFVAGISLFISGCLFKSGVEGKAWFRYASKYDQARSELIANDMAKKNSAIQDFAKMGKMKHKFLQAKQPTEAEIISVLKSPDRRFQRVGLAAMFLKPIETDRLIDILFGFIQDRNFYFREYALYPLNEFTKFPASRKAELGKQLLQIIKTKKDNELSIQEITLLAKFPSEEAVFFLTGQLMKEGKESQIRIFRYAAFRTLKEMGGSYYAEAAEYVNMYGSPEIQKELLGCEKSWERLNASTEKE